MPAIDFPAAPAVNDEYSFEGRTWRWNGTGWEVKEYPAALLAGTAANPSLYFSGDPNTGLYSPGADQVAISTGGTGRLLVDASGNVTIPAGGTLGVNGAAPQSPIDVISNASSYGISLRGRSSDNVSQFRFASNNHASVYSQFESGPTYLAASVNGSERLRIDSTGNVGIGTSSPGQRLEIQATAGASQNAVIRLRATDSGSNAGSVADISAIGTGAQVSALAFSTRDGTNIVERLRIDGAGNVGIGTSSPAVALDVVAGIRGQALDATGSAVLFSSAGGGVLYHNGSGTAVLRAYSNGSGAAGNLTFNASGSENVRITSTGNVGIGTSSPQGKLTVIGDSATPGNGNINISNAAFPTSGWAFRIPDSSSVIDLSLDGAIAGTWRSVMYFARGTGNVGIGTSSPGSRLTIVDATDSVAAVTVNISNSDANNERLGVDVVCTTGGTGTNGSNVSLGLFRGTYNGYTGFDHKTLNLVTNASQILGTSQNGYSFYNATQFPASGSSADFNQYYYNQYNYLNLNATLSNTGANGSFPTRYFGIYSKVDAPNSENQKVYNLYLENGGTPSSTSNWAIYQVSSSVSNYFAGNVVIGQTSSALQSGGTGITVYGSTSSEVKFLNSTVGALSTDGTALVATGVDFSVNNREAGSLVFGTSNTERVRIDSAGRLLVGTSTSASAGVSQYARLQIQGNTFATPEYGILSVQRSEAATSISSGEDLGRIVFTDSAGNEFGGITCTADAAAGNNDYPGRLVFLTTADGASSPTEAMRINNQRELLIGTTTRTANGGVLQISNGITFPGTQSACSDANTLDDYEEGTFTPTIIGTSVAGTGTYTTQVGRYTKIGNRVRFTVYIIWTAHTGTGNLRASALPFTSNVTTSNFNAIAIYHSNIAMTAGNTMQSYVDIGNTQIAIAQVPTGGGGASAVPMDTAGEIMLTGTYEV